MRETRRILLVPVLLMLVGCGGRVQRTDFDTLYLHLAQNLNTLDPAMVTDVAGGQVVANIHANLVRYDVDGKLVGDLASDWTVSDNARTWRFDLRSEAKFADGTPVTPEDVVRSFTRMLLPATHSPRTWVLDRIAGAALVVAGKTEAVSGLRKTGERQVEITLEKPCSSFAGMLTMPAAAVVPPGAIDFTRAGFGAGPYRVKEFVPSEHLLLEANPHYYAGPPRTSRIHYRIIVEEAARLTEFRQGRIDIMDVPDPYYEKLTTDPATRDYIDAAEAVNVYYLGFNCTMAPFDSARVRRAFCQGLDRKMLVEALLAGRATPAIGPIPPCMEGFDPTLAPLPYDLETARAQLTAAGFDFSRSVRLVCASRPDTVKICQVLANELSKLGVRIELVPYEWGTFTQKLRAGDFDLYYNSWWADYLDPENFLVPLFAVSPARSTGNATGYASAELDALLMDLVGTTKPEARTRLIRQIQERVRDDAPRLFLWHRKAVTVRQPWVTNYRLFPIFNADTGRDIALRRPTD